jgi:glutamate carboxypeptidase
MIEKFRKFLIEREKDQFLLLKKLVLQPSYSKNKNDVDSMGKMISHELAELKMSQETVVQSETGNHLIFRSLACKNHDKSILLVGHMDTVFPPESGFDWYREKDNKIFGPGVIDMKGGLVTIIFALKSLDHYGLLTKIPVTVICNSDEEIGSPTSKDLIVEEAKKAIFALVFECGGMNYEIVTGRKGKSGLTLEVIGKAGHAAFAGSVKQSAILELAHKIIAIEQLNDPICQLVVNVGTIEGGIGPNTVPEKASAQIDIRYLSHSDGETCIASIKSIADNCSVIGTKGVLKWKSGRTPMAQSPGNLALFRQIKNMAEKLKIPIKAELRSGVSDANTIATTSLPVVDGMGPIGDCDHSDQEYMIRDSLHLKTLLSAVVIDNGWTEYRQNKKSD